MNSYLLIIVCVVFVFFCFNREYEKEAIVTDEDEKYEYCSGFIHRRDSKMPESCLNNFESEQCRLEFKELNAEAIASKECFLKCMNNSIA